MNNWKIYLGSNELRNKMKYGRKTYVLNCPIAAASAVDLPLKYKWHQDYFEISISVGKLVF